MLCFSPIGESFRTRLRMYPSLVNCCTIDWFQVWPEDALEQVALRSTTNIDVAENIKVNAVVACKYFHVCAKEISNRFYRTLGRKTYITSTAFLDLIRAFGALIKIKQDETKLARFGFNHQIIFTKINTNYYNGCFKQFLEIVT